MADKIKIMEKYLNILHYCLYKTHYKFHLLVRNLNPFNLIHKLPFQKRRYEKLGIDIHKEIDKAFGNKNFGLSITVAGGILWGGGAIFLFSFLLIFNITISMFYILACGLLSGAISYYFVFKNDKYLNYFNIYEKWSKAEKKRYSWLTLASVIAVFFLFYLGVNRK